jgi:hypothetical protein
MRAPTIAPFALPKNGELFTDTIIRRSEDLIESGIWEGFEKVKLDTWLLNFTNTTEKYFAACILDAFIYRSERQTIALMKQILQRSIPDCLRLSNPVQGPSSNWFEQLVENGNEKDPKIRIVPVIRDSDPPTKSGPLVARLYKRKMNINDKWMIWPWQISDAVKAGIQTFLFIDDFLGTGRQFYNFSNRFNLTAELSKSFAIYAPLVAHDKGVRFLRDKTPFIKVCSAESLDNTHSLFHQKSKWFNDGSNSPASALTYYKGILINNRLTYSKNRSQGFGKLCIAYSFQHAIPNNCISILWNKSNSWKPLLGR